MNEDSRPPEQRPVGLWQHGEMLVVHLKNAEFPDRCVLSNEITSGPQFHYREKISPQRAQEMSRRAANAASAFAKGVAASGAAASMAVAAPIAVLAPAAVLAMMKTVTLEFGLSADAQQRYTKRKNLAVRLILGGLLVTFILPVSFLIVSGDSRNMSTSATAMLIACAVGGSVALFGGLIYHVIAVRQPIRIMMCDGTYAWFSGVHPEFLSSLPRFDVNSLNDSGP